MRKLLILLALCPLAGFAQFEFSAGLEAGPILTHIQGDQLAGFNKIGIAGGPYVKVRFSNKVGACLRTCFSPKGSRSRPNTQAGNFDQRGWNLNYFEIPVSITWEVGNAIALEAGHYFAVLQSQRDYRGGTFGTIYDYDDTDIGFQFGATWRFAKKFHMHARYSLSVLPINGSLIENSGNGIVAGSYNHAIYINVGIRFNGMN